MNKIKYSAIGLLALVSQVVSAEVLIKGRLLDEAQQAVGQAQVTISGESVKTDKQGYYQIKVDDADVYQLSINKSGYYNSVQTFSHFELNNKAEPLTIADITLVEKAKGRVMLAFGGDVMMGRRYYKPYFGDSVLIHNESRLADSRALVEHVKPYMSLADIAAVNLETQVAATEPKERAPKSVTFFSRPETLNALSWAGIDYVTLGNNHTYDYVDSGLHSTLKFLRASELGFSGADVNEEKALAAYQTQVNGVDFGMLGYVGWEGSSTPNQTAGKNKGGAAYGSMKNIVNSVKQQVAEKHVPIVQYHGSLEYANNPTGVTEQRLKSAIDAGAALAVAHHSHVTQGLELYNGKLIAYSMGNFVFDQFIAQTPFSFILYVWLDEGQFHRAELVPIYLKGYKPTPATGVNRYTVMKRLAALSAQRNTYVGRSGGHGVITSEQPETNKQAVNIDFVDNKLASLYLSPWQKNVIKVNVPQGIQYRLGTNLVHASDFESFDTFNSPDRSWVYDRAKVVLNDYGASGNKSLGIKLDDNQPSEFGMQAFTRVYRASNPMTITAKVKADQPVRVNFYWQGRKTRDKFFKARNERPKNLIGSVDIKPGQDWQTLAFDFNSPRIGYRAYRVLASVELLGDKPGQVDIDDFAAVEWQTAFSSNQKPNLFNVDVSQASFIGVNKTTNQPVELTLK